MSAVIRQLLGDAYGWDSELGELSYLGNPLAYWLTDYEAAMVAQAKLMTGTN